MTGGGRRGVDLPKMLKQSVIIEERHSYSGLHDSITIASTVAYHHKLKIGVMGSASGPQTECMHACRLGNRQGDREARPRLHQRSMPGLSHDALRAKGWASTLGAPSGVLEYEHVNEHLPRTTTTSSSTSARDRGAISPISAAGRRCDRRRRHRHAQRVHHRLR